jgi:MoxR-like ATPase
MEERQVTIDGNTYVMNKPFLVFATQNPLEHEGTYRLPEAQLDWFLFKIDVGYPSMEEEMIILQRNNERKGKKEIDEVSPVMSLEQLIRYQDLVKQVLIEDNLRMFIAQIVNKTRNNASLYLSASPRASINIMNAAKSFAAMKGRDFVTPDDIREIVPHVLKHRIILTPEKEMEGKTPETIIAEIISNVEVPR